MTGTPMLSWEVSDIDFNIGATSFPLVPPDQAYHRRRKGKGSLHSFYNPVFFVGIVIQGIGVVGDMLSGSTVKCANARVMS